MLVSCNSETFGAKYKDKQIKEKADYAELINPVEELPTDYIEFTFDGKVQAVQKDIKGTKTITILNLNDNSLIERRKTAIINLLKMKEFLIEDEMVAAIGEFETMVRQLYRDYECSGETKTD